MYFACTPPDGNFLADELLSSFQALLVKDAALHLYAIVDAAFDSRLARRVRNSGVSIAAESSLAEIKNHLPFVFPLDECLSSTELAGLVAETGGRPMLSFVASRMLAEPLAHELQRFLIARSEDDMRWPLRFADTRILPALLGEMACAPATVAIPAGLAAWWWPHRDGRLSAVFSNNASPITNDQESQELDLSDKQFASMMNAALPDAIIANLHEACPDILDQYSRHDNYSKVSAALELLTQKRFDSAELQLRWAALALSFSRGLGSIPALAVALAEAKNSSDLLARIDQLPAEVWATQETEA